MFTMSLISLPAETLQRLANEQTEAPSGGGGDATERGAGLAVIGLATLLATLFALLL